MAHGGDEARGDLDCVDAGFQPVLVVALRIDLIVAQRRMRVAAADRHPRPFEPALDRQHVAPGRLGDQHRLGELAPGDRIHGAEAAGFLVDHRVDRQPALELDVGLADGVRRRDASRDTALMSTAPRP